MEPWWEQVRGPQLAQGDFLRDCVVPIMPADFSPPLSETIEAEYIFGGRVYDLIVVTQSCDLENGKAPFVAACPVSPLTHYERANPGFGAGGRWEQVRQGRIEGLHLLASFTNPEDNTLAMLVDFRQIFSLPVEYLSNLAEQSGSRWRLRSPFLEHFSQAFARFFMRVGLPSDIPRFR